jgi:CRP-like cAMP-binding protein
MATTRSVRLEALISEGPGGGFLARLPARAAEALLGEAVRLDLPPGAVIYRDDEAPRVVVVIAGVLRLFMGDPDGRQVTVVYGCLPAAARGGLARSSVPGRAVKCSMRYGRSSQAP